MASLQQEHREIGGSNRIVAVDATPPPSTTANNYKDSDDQEHPNHLQSPIFGTQCVIVETGLQAGASHRYELLWTILIGFTFALIIQSLAANIGVSTGKHLAEICKAEYPRYVCYCLWFLAEISVIAADIPEGMNLYHFLFVYANDFC
ncbi:hypothetical protein RJ640_011808 [Escallonia rubra]|uniref:Uncharacterized protein n=1 Tax=Escallonia rubra TaxID=112253 RepID=A0AA88UBJ9_9ASTE|nr:hypothetical protein RJ640_011808 [Escallonia rubra]